MARRDSTEPTREKRTRVRRTDEDLVRHLQARIEEIQRRAEARKAKQTPGVALTLKALRTIDKATSAAEKEGDTALRHVLSDARDPLAEFLRTKGVAVADTRRPRGRRPKP